MLIPKSTLTLLLVFFGVFLIVEAQYGKLAKLRYPPVGTRYYPVNTRRRWRVRGQPGVCIQFKLRGLHIEKSTGCSTDYLDVYDGQTNSSQRIMHTCGIPTPVPKPFISSSNSLLVVFFSDSNNKTGRGFEALVTTVHCVKKTLPAAPPPVHSQMKCGNPQVAPQETGLHSRQKRGFGDYHEFNTGHDDGHNTESYRNTATETYKGQEQSRIVGGVVAKSNSWPWQVSIRFQGNHICGGAIVSPRAIISAAHCFKRVSINPNDFEFWVGKHLKDEREPNKEQKLIGERIIIHPNYEKTGKHDSDLAVITLAHPGATFNQYVHPICLPPTGFIQPADDSTCYVSGFGTTKGTGGDRYLKEAALPVVSNNRCGQMDSRLRPLLTERMMCAGYKEGGHDSCQGDSGGPLSCKIGTQDTWVLSGVVSFGFGCAGESSPGVYVRVNKFLSWLRPIITDLP